MNKIKLALIATVGILCFACDDEKKKKKDAEATPATEAAEPAAKAEEPQKAEPQPVKSPDYSAALQIEYPFGTIGENRPIKVTFESVKKQGDSYAVSGYSVTKAAKDTFDGTLAVSNAVVNGEGYDCEVNLSGTYNLVEKESKTSGYFKGNFNACLYNNAIVSAEFNGSWVKSSNNKETPCSWFWNNN